MFSMSRDGALPFARSLGHVNPVTGTPIKPAILIGLLAAALLVINVGKAALFTDLTSACIVTLYAAYLFVTVPSLIRRLRGGIGGEVGEAHFSLGRWGLPVNLIAVAYGALMTINMAWPRVSVYDPNHDGWALQWFSVLLLGGTFVTGAIAFTYLRRAKRITLLVGERALPAAARS
jgi:amino acid transporter